MKKIIGLFLIVFIWSLWYSGAWYVDSNCQGYAAWPWGEYNIHVVSCSSHWDYADILLRSDTFQQYIVTHYPSQFSGSAYTSIYPADISWCTWTAFWRTGTQVYSIVTKKSCCSEWNRVDENGNCVVNCTNWTYYGKNQDKCCATSSGYLAYKWKKKDDSWYYTECDEWVLYKKWANDVVFQQDGVPENTGANSYSFCWKGNVVTENWRCIPCAGAANLSGISINPNSTINCHIVCSEDEVAFTWASWAPGCCPGTVKDWVCHQELLKMWVRVNNACLIDGQCGLNIYRILWIRASDNYNPSVSNVASDVINAAISFMGTVVTIVFVVTWIICSMNSISGKDTKKMMKVFVDSAVWMLMVWWSYAIIRLVQFIATAWS